MQMQCSDTIYMVKNESNKHWCLFEYSKLSMKARVWQSLPGYTRVPEVKLILKHLAHCGVAMPCVGVDHVPICIMEHGDWCQHDASSCGLFALLILFSRIEGRRVRVTQSDVFTWRKALLRSIVDKLLSL